LSSSFQHVDHDGFQVLARSNRSCTQVFGQGTPKFERQDQPHVIRGRARLRPTSDSDLGGLLWVPATGPAALVCRREGKLGLVGTTCRWCASPPAHLWKTTVVAKRWALAPRLVPSSRRLRAFLR